MAKRRQTQDDQHERVARVYDSIGRLCTLPKGISSMTISVGRRSVTIDKANSPRMGLSARSIAAAVRAKRGQ